MNGNETEGDNLLPPTVRRLSDPGHQPAEEQRPLPKRDSSPSRRRFGELERAFRKWTSKIPELESLYYMIETGLGELDNTEKILAVKEKRFATGASWTKWMLLVLGASVVTKEATSRLIGTSNPVNIVIYMIIGLLVTALAGIEVAFKWEDRSGRLGILAATCKKIKRQTTSRLIEIFATETDEKLLISSAKEHLVSLNAKIDDIQEEAAKLGINIPLEWQKLSRRWT